MDLYRVSIEAHRFGGTISVAGFLADLAASRTEELIQGLSRETARRARQRRAARAPGIFEGVKAR
jgi:hypothetical protein